MRDRIGRYTMLFMVTVIPLMVFGHQMILTEGSVRYMTGVTTESGIQYDFFTYYKEVFLGVAGGVLLLRERSLKGGWRKTAYLIMVMALVSYFTAYNREIALMGITERYEGLIAQTAYMAIFICGLEIFDRGNRKLIVRGLLASSSLIFIIGIFQFFGHNIFASDVGKQLMTGFRLGEFGELSHNFGARTLYGTFGNPNYMGSYGVIMFFLGAGKYLTSRRKVVYGGYTLLAYANLIGSHSRAGQAGLYAGGFLLLILMGKEVKKYWRKLGVLIALMCVIWLGLNSWSDKYMEDKLEFDRGEISDLYAVNPVEGGIIIEGKRNLVIRNDDGIRFYDEVGQEIETARGNGRTYLNREGYEDYGIQRNPSNPDHYLLSYGEFRYELLWSDGKYYTRDHLNRFTEIREVGRFKLLDGYEKKGSKRGYIWSRSIPLILERPMFGWGQDNFVLAFPQGDYFGKELFYGNKGMLVDKAHNYYLQTGINNGLIYLGVVLAMYCVYFFSGVYREVREKTSLRVFIFTGSIAYLVTLLFNDSVVSVAPVFWCLMSMVAVWDRRNGF